jgi:hypothetical protein
MPTVRKLAPEEVRTLENKGKGQRKLIEEEYDSYLADYGVGDYAVAELGEEENRLTVRNRFKAAATRRGLSLHFHRTTGNLIRFQILGDNGHEGGSLAGTSDSASAAVASDAPPTSGKGRTRKKKDQ